MVIELSDPEIRAAIEQYIFNTTGLKASVEIKSEWDELQDAYKYFITALVDTLKRDPDEGY